MKKRNLAILWRHRSIFGRFWEPQRSPKMVPQWRGTLTQTTFLTTLEAFCVPDSIFFNFHSQNGSPKDPRGPPELPKMAKNRQKNRLKLEAKKKHSNNQFGRKKAWLVVFFGRGCGWLGCCWVVGWLSCFLFAGLLCCWVVCWVVGLLGCWVVGLLGCWVVGMLGCCVVGLLGCLVVGLQQHSRKATKPTKTGKTEKTTKTKKTTLPPTTQSIWPGGMREAIK